MEMNNESPADRAVLAQGFVVLRRLLNRLWAAVDEPEIKALERLTFLTEVRLCHLDGDLTHEVRDRMLDEYELTPETATAVLWQGIRPYRGSMLRLLRRDDLSDTERLYIDGLAKAAAETTESVEDRQCRVVSLFNREHPNGRPYG
jgi:hypothetical protein